MFKKALVVVVAALVVAQAFRPDRSNPTVDPTKTLAAAARAPLPPDVATSLERACGDCHSSGTVWPWYTNISPLSWWIAHHVEEGRREVSFSTWANLEPRRKFKKLEEMCEQVEKKDMPMPSYLLIHRDAALSDGERQAICTWTKLEQQALGPLPPAPEGEGRGRGRGRRRD